MQNFHAKTIDDYISNFEPDVQERLQELRKIIQETLPEATETISYQMPTFDLYGRHVTYFGAFKEHIGFFPYPSGVEEFQKLSKDYKTAKGTIQFPYNKPFPVTLIKKVLKFRAQENLEKMKSKSKGKY